MKRYSYIILFIAIIISGLLSSCDNFGEKVVVNKGEVYYKEPVKKGEADALGKYLAEQQYFDGQEKSVQILKTGNNYTVKFVVKEGAENDQANINIFKIFSPILSANVFNAANVNIEMCDAQLKTLVTIPYINWGKKYNLNGDNIYYKDPLTETDAKILADYLVKSGFFKGAGITSQIEKTGNTYAFKFVVKKGMESDQQYIEMIKLFATQISENVFNGAQVDIHLCDDLLNTLKTVVVI